MYIKLNGQIESYTYSNSLADLQNKKLTRTIFKTYNIITCEYTYVPFFKLFYYFSTPTY